MKIIEFFCDIFTFKYEIKILIQLLFSLLPFPHAHTQQPKKMSSEFQFNESVRESSYAHYNYYHCDKCDMGVSMKELSKHVATKHRDLRFDEDLSGDTDDDLDSMGNGVGRNIESKKQSTKNSKFGQNYIGKQQRAAAPIPAAVGVTQTSGDETDFLPFHSNLSMMKKGLFDDDGIDSTSTPNRTVQNVRSSARSLGRRPANKWQMAKSFSNESGAGDAVMAQNRQRKIPTAHELFDYSRNSSEFRTSKVAKDGEGGAGSSCGIGGGKLRRYESTFKRRSVPVQRDPPVIPENFESCRFCSNVMHQDYIGAHIERKHRHILAAANEPLADAGIIGNVPNNVASDTGNGVAGCIGGVIGKIKKTNEPMFVRCKFCSAHMHVHYMPLHLVRKHRTEYDGSIGFCWIQCTDDQVNKLISSNRACVKNGAFYINDSE